MNIDSALRTEADYEAALQEAAGLMDAEQGTPEGERLDALTTLIVAYQDEHHRIDPPDAIEAIKFMMEQKGLTPVGLGDPRRRACSAGTAHLRARKVTHSA